MSQHRATALVFALPVMLTAAGGVLAADVVYDNTDVHTKGGFAPDGVWNFNVFEAYEYMGDQVTLAVTSATITRFDLVLFSTQATVLDELRLSLLPVDTYTYEIGEPYWTGQLYDVAVDGLTVVTFNGLNVAVPQELVWAAAGDSDIAGLATFNPPFVGSSSTAYYWDKAPEPDGWVPLHLGSGMPANFGARIWAVPEPTTMLVLAAGSLGLIARKRRISA